MMKNNKNINKFNNPAYSPLVHTRNPLTCLSTFNYGYANPSNTVFESLLLPFNTALNSRTVSTSANTTFSTPTPTADVLHPWFITGFADGEATFTASIYKRSDRKDS